MRVKSAPGSAAANRSHSSAVTRPPAGQPQRAAEVYGFLSSFTAGVQRGLEAARAVHGDAPDG